MSLHAAGRAGHSAEAGRAWATPVLRAWDAHSGPIRLLRTGVFAVASTALALSAHRLAGGEVPGATTITLALAVLLALGTALSRRERSGLQITVVVLVTQALLHVGFMLPTMSTSMSSSMPGGTSTPVPLSSAALAKLLFCFPDTAAPPAAKVTAAMSGMDTSHLSRPPMTTATQVAAHMSDNPFTVAGLGMLTAHLLAAAAMAWWLRRGERAAWSVVERVVTTLISRPVAVLVAGRPERLRTVDDMWLPTQRVWGSGLAGRGPPGADRLAALTA